jgi:hypothetical protein
VTTGITGASGALGKALMRLIPDAVPIGHSMPEQQLDRIIHAACPAWRNEDAIRDFDRFNLALAQYVKRHQPEMVNVGSWWQVAEGMCRHLSYTRLKDHQQHLFPDARHVVAYSIFGPDKGFGLDVARHISGERPMRTVGTAWRDFVHTDDVVSAIVRAFEREPGVYAACTGEPVRVSAVLASFGIRLPYMEMPPQAELRYPVENLAPTTVHLSDFIAHLVAANAAEQWAEQSRAWRAA